MKLYRGWTGWEGGGVGVGGGRKTEGLVVIFYPFRDNTAVLCVQYCTETATVNLARPLTVTSSSCRPQAALLVPISGPIDPSSGPSWFHRVVKRPPVKADLAICSPIIGTCGHC